MYTPTANGYFSGGGLMEVGLMQAGIKMQQSLDLDPKATRCMQLNPKYFDHSILTCDIAGKEALPDPESDIMAGAYPCNRYSAIGDIHGVRTGDELYLHFLRHIVLKRPAAYILENVPGMRKFSVVMEAMTKLPDYYVNVICPVNANYWLPQERKRLIVIGTRKPFTVRHPERSATRVQLKDILEKNAKIKMTDSAIARLKGKYRDMPIIVDPENPDALAPTCIAHYAKDFGTRLVKDKSRRHGVRPFTIREYARLQGVPDDFNFEPYNYSYAIIGNGVPVNMARWAGIELMRYFN